MVVNRTTVGNNTELIYENYNHRQSMTCIDCSLSFVFMKFPHDEYPHNNREESMTGNSYRSTINTHLSHIYFTQAFINVMENTILIPSVSVSGRGGLKIGRGLCMKCVHVFCDSYKTVHNAICECE